MNSSTKTASMAMIQYAVVLMLVSFASADVNQDKAECANQLGSLANCLSYVSGQAKAPTSSCCSGLEQVLAKSKKCLCILIKDRDDPGLGIKFNATLAAILPSACHAPSYNVTECISILNLSTSSPDAKIFEELANITKSISSAPASTGSPTTTASTTAQEKSDAWRVTMTWLGEEKFNIICGFLLLLGILIL